MRIKDTLRVLAGVAVVYVGIAACGAAEGGGSATNGTSSGSAGASGGTSGASSGTSGSLADAFVDALVSPVKDAKAGPNPPLVATEACDKSLTTSGPTKIAAIHAFPGKTVNDLGALQVIAHHASPQLVVSSGGVNYEHEIGTLLETYLADGSAATVCYAAGETITFILPQ